MTTAVVMAVLTASAALTCAQGTARADTLPPDYPASCPASVTARQVIVTGEVDYCRLTGTHVSLSLAPTIVAPGGLVTVTANLTGSLNQCTLPTARPSQANWWSDPQKTVPTWSIGAPCHDLPSVSAAVFPINFFGGELPTLTPVSPQQCVQAGLSAIPTCTYRVDYDPHTTPVGYWGLVAGVEVETADPAPVGAITGPDDTEPIAPTQQCAFLCTRAVHTWVDYDEEAFKTTDGSAPPPVAASFTSSQPDATKPIIAFDASTSTGTAPLSYDWDFGDGQTATNGGVTPQHTYGAPGKYTVKLTVHDGVGQTATVSHDVVIPGFQVNSEGDTGDANVGDGVCDTGAKVAGGAAECTLRAAIQESDLASGAQPISFNIPGISGVPDIQPASALPAITNTVSIDGTTQQGGQVEVSGNGTPDGTDGLALQSKGNTVKGLVIDGWAGGSALHITGEGGNTIVDNYIGTAPDGSAESGDNRQNGVGILIDDSPNNVVGGPSPDGNVIAHNLDLTKSAGITVQGANAADNTIAGNVVGKADDPASDTFNTTGILVVGAPRTIIGGATANLIGGNGSDVEVDGRTDAVDGTKITGNRIGVDAANTILGYPTASNNGVVLLGSVTNSTISNNTISGHTFDVAAVGDGVVKTTIDNNRIGTTSGGGDLVDQLGAYIGITVDGSPQTQVTNNIVAGHSDIDVLVLGVTQTMYQHTLHGDDFDPPVTLTGTSTATGTVLTGNTIGLLTGTPSLPTTRASKGVYLGNAANTLDFNGNLISGHRGAEVEIAGGTNNSVEGNTIGPARGGTATVDSRDGVRVRGAAETTIGAAGSGNQISGLSGTGVLVAGGFKGGTSSPAASNTTIAGNRIGTTANGLAALANGTGIIIGDGATTTVVGRPGAGNVISGNTNIGVATASTLGAPPSGLTIAGNSIGAASGGTSLPNATGVALTAGSGITVGGLDTGAGNTIAFNTQFGVARPSGGPAGITILSNLIHHDGGGGISLGADASNPKPPSLQSVTLTGGHTVVSGTLPGAPANSVYRIQLFTNTACDASGRGQGQTLLDAGQTVVADGSTFSLTTSAVSVGTVVTATATDTTLGTSEFSNCAAAVSTAPIGTAAGVASQGPTGFGQPLTLTATITPSAGSGTPTGTVQFSNGANKLGGPVALSGGKASITLPAFAPGQAVTATYSGDSSFSSSTSPPFTPQITFSHPALTGPIGGSMKLSGGTWLISGATIGGSLTIGPGTSVAIVSSTVGKVIQATGGGAFTLCGSTVRGAVSISGATGFVLIGDPADDGCAGNILMSSVTLSSNHAGVELAHNSRIAALVTVTGNTGSTASPEDAHPEIEANTVYGGLACAGDSPAADDGGQPNAVLGVRSGECKSPKF